MLESEKIVNLTDFYRYVKYNEAYSPITGHLTT